MKGPALAKARKVLARQRDQATRRRLHRQQQLRWWLVHGSTRSGTTFLHKAIAASARLHVSDWTLAPAFQLPPQLPHSRFDHARAMRDISANVLDNAPRGGGDVLDLAFKQSWLKPHEYEHLVQIWGPPERTIFCVREPSGYMASATRKFAGHLPTTLLQDWYVESLLDHAIIGGEILHYGPGLETADYRKVLDPLVLPPGKTFEFRFTGSSADDLVTDDMAVAYANFVRQHGLEQPE